MTTKSENSKSSQQGWVDVALKRLGPKHGEFKTAYFIESVGVEILGFQSLKETFEKVSFNRTLKQFEKLGNRINEASEAISEIDAGTRWLFSTWYSDATHLFPERKKYSPQSTSQVLGSLDKMENELSSWGKSLSIMSNRLVGQPPFKGKGNLSSRPQYILAYKVRSLYKDIFELPYLPTDKDEDFDIILIHLFKELDCDSNTSRVYKNSTPTPL